MLRVQQVHQLQSQPCEAPHERPPQIATARVPSAGVRQVVRARDAPVASCPFRASKRKELRVSSLQEAVFEGGRPPAAHQREAHASKWPTVRVRKVFQEVRPARPADAAHP